eukprot:1140571-Pelagomonas_calceolata.AAC.1
MPSTPTKMMYKVTLLFLCSVQGGKGIGIREDFESNKVNVPVLRRDLSRIKVRRPAWDRGHKGSSRAALCKAEEPVPFEIKALKVGSKSREYLFVETMHQVCPVKCLWDGVMSALEQHTSRTSPPIVLKISTAKKITQHHWCALPTRKGHVRIPLYTSQMSVIGIAQSIVRNVAQFRLHVHSLKVEQASADTSVPVFHKASSQ